MGGSSRVEMVAVQISYRGEAEIVQVRYNRLDIATESDCALAKKEDQKKFYQVAGDFSDGGGASWQPEHLVNRGGGELNNNTPAIPEGNVICEIPN